MRKSTVKSQNAFQGGPEDVTRQEKEFRGPEFKRGRKAYEAARWKMRIAERKDAAQDEVNERKLPKEIQLCLAKAAVEVNCAEIGTMFLCKAHFTEFVATHDAFGSAVVGPNSDHQCTQFKYPPLI